MQISIHITVISPRSERPKTAKARYEDYQSGFTRHLSRILTAARFIMRAVSLACAIEFFPISVGSNNRHGKLIEGPSVKRSHSGFDELRITYSAHW